MYKISICIPTYNRANYLIECLDSVLKAIIGFENQVEIVVSDNASEDNTEMLMQDYCLDYPFIKYYKNEINIGAEGNFFLAIERSSGKYCLLLGDDDKITSDAIEQIINILNQYCNLSILILNYAMYDKIFDIELNSSFHKILTDKYYGDKNLVMSDFGPSLSFISSVVFEREAIKKINIKNYNYFKEYGFSFLYMIYDYLSQKQSCFYLSKPLILQRSDNSSVDIKKFFFHGLPKVFDYLKDYGYSVNVLTESKERIFEIYLKYHILDMKLKKLQIDDEIRDLTFTVLTKNSNKLIAFLLFYLPNDFFIVLRKIKRKIRNK